MYFNKDEKIIIQSDNSLIGYLFWPIVLTIIFFIFIIPIIWLIFRIVAYNRNNLILTNKRITGKTGLITTKEMDSPLNQITAMYIDNSITGRIFNYETVVVTTASSIHKFKFLNNGRTMHNCINKYVQKFEDDRIMKQAQAIAEASNK